MPLEVVCATLANRAPALRPREDGMQKPKTQPKPAIDTKENQVKGSLQPEAPEWLKTIHLLVKTFGIPIAILITIVALSIITYWNIPHIIQLPGVKHIATALFRDRLPTADSGKFNIGVTHFNHDSNEITENLVFLSLHNQFSQANTKRFDRSISTDISRYEGHQQAQKLLKESGFDVLVWGAAITGTGKSIPVLHLTVLPDETKAPAKNYLTSDTETLPQLFWQDLTKVLALVVASRYVDFTEANNQHRAEKLLPFINQVRELLANSQSNQWAAATRAEVMGYLGIAYTMYGNQSISNEALQQAVDTLREAIRLLDLKQEPLELAMLQNNLGSALQQLGARKGDPSLLEEAIAILRLAEKEPALKQKSIAWETVQFNLGIALGDQGKRETGTKRLTESITAFRKALEKGKESAIQRASVQNNLGTIIQALAQRENDPEQLNTAVKTYREALQVFDIDHTPMSWAMTQNNLGTALLELSTYEEGQARQFEAVIAFREALRANIRELAPHQWAMTNYNFGIALHTLGVNVFEPTIVREAVTAFREALGIYSREQTPEDWASTKSKLGGALLTLGDYESDPAQLKEAVKHFREVLEEYTNEQAPFNWNQTQFDLGTALYLLSKYESKKAALEEAAIVFRTLLKELPHGSIDRARTQNRLGTTLRVLGESERGTARLKEAVTLLREALRGFSHKETPRDWAQTQSELGVALLQLGVRKEQPNLLTEAIRAYEAALIVYREENDDKSAQRVEENISTIKSVISLKLINWPVQKTE